LPRKTQNNPQHNPQQKSREDGRRGGFSVALGPSLDTPAHLSAAATSAATIATSPQICERIMSRSSSTSFVHQQCLDDFRRRTALMSTPSTTLKRATTANGSLGVGLETWNAVWNALPFGVALISANARIERANSALYNQLGCSPESIINDSLHGQRAQVIVPHLSAKTLSAVCAVGGGDSKRDEKASLFGTFERVGPRALATAGEPWIRVYEWQATPIDVADVTSRWIVTVSNVTVTEERLLPYKPSLCNL
jgi:PAS domain-containing protein